MDRTEKLEHGFLDTRLLEFEFNRIERTALAVLHGNKKFRFLLVNVEDPDDVGVVH